LATPNATAAALEAVADEAEPLLVDVDPALPLVLEAEELEPEEPPPAVREAFLVPQMKDWQNVWPLRSLGWAAVHCPFHSSHSREGRVWA